MQVSQCARSNLFYHTQCISIKSFRNSWNLLWQKIINLWFQAVQFNTINSSGGFQRCVVFEPFFNWSHPLKQSFIWNFTTFIGLILFIITINHGTTLISTQRFHYVYETSIYYSFNRYVVLVVCRIDRLPRKKSKPILPYLGPGSKTDISM